MTTALAVALAASAAGATPAGAEFPYRLTSETPRPSDLTGKRVWMYASTPAPAADPQIRADPRELHGIRGAHVVDADGDAPQAWHLTTGRPDVTIAVLDSGIKWDDRGAMEDLRRKTRLTKAELPLPRHDRGVPLEGERACADYADDWDANRDGVFDVLDYACDSRVALESPHGVGPAGMLEPQDVLIAFSDGTDADGNGYVDDIVGWDFVDDDNDPYDDVRYGHGTGEARDSAGEADNGGDLGTCPNCMVVHMRVGTSFIADVNRFALAVLYAADNDVEVVQEALGTLNKSRLGADAVRYAYEHGTVVIASAADEAAQHHNWPSSYPYSIVVNSVTHSTRAEPAARSYLEFNGCTNFSSRITLAIPSVSCSSDATGRASGMAGLVYSAALDAIEAGKLEPHPTCRQTDGGRCPVSANEVRQLMASGMFGGRTTADDVNFAQDPVTGESTELSCRPVALPGCTDPFAAAPTTRVAGAGRSYPAREGHDQFYGYGRVNMYNALEPITRGVLPPEAELTSPEWYDMVDPAQEAFEVTGEAFDRGRPYRCKVLVAPGSYASDAQDFVQVPGGTCDGSSVHTARVTGRLATIAVDDLEKLFPATAGDFTGREPGLGEQPHSARPNSEPYGFVVKLVVEGEAAAAQDRRQAYLHRDADMLPGFPKQLDGDGEASPVLADLDGDNANELVVANSDGLVHAFRSDGSSLEGFPARTDVLPLHPGSRAFESGEVEEAHGAVLATPAVGDLDRDGAPEIVVADLEGKVYVISSDGRVLRRWQTRVEWSGKPLAPFQNVRKGRRHRTQMGFIASPVLADLDGDDGGRLEIVAASMDRHVYAWNDDGSDVPGYPVLVVDRSKVDSIDPVTHRVDFKTGIGPDYDQGAIISTPAVGDLDGKAGPEIVVGTNESYGEPLNAGGLPAEALYGALGTALEPANGRLFAIRNAGVGDGNLMTEPWLDGWPFKVGILQAGVLPMVGEGITGAPVIGQVPCGSAERRTAVGVIPAAGVPYLVAPDGVSCFGREAGKDVGLPTQGGAATDQPFLPAFGHPAFGTLAGRDAFLAPAAGLQRALDVVLPEYQGGKDYLVAWETESGRVAPGWPAEMNDLQFLTGPSLADIDALPGDEVVAGSAHHDLQAFTGAGTDVSPAWPKVTGDWTVANPATGPFGRSDSKAIVGLTRSGRVLAYRTAADACAPGAWPTFHHDRHNSGDSRTDAVAPGRPTRARVARRVLRFSAPGDDLLCGKPDRYEVRTSDEPIDEGSFASARPVATTSGQGGLVLTGELDRYVAVRAVDEAGNVGRPATVDLLAAGDSPQPGRPSGRADASVPPSGAAGPPVVAPTRAPASHRAQARRTMRGEPAARCARRSEKARRGMRLRVLRARTTLTRVATRVHRVAGTRTFVLARRGRIRAIVVMPRGEAPTRLAVTRAVRRCSG